MKKNYEIVGRKIDVVETIVTPLKRLKDHAKALFCAPMIGMFIFGTITLAITALMALGLFVIALPFSKIVDLLKGNTSSCLAEGLNVFNIFCIILFLFFCIISGIICFFWATSSLYAMFIQLVLDCYDNKKFSWPTISHAMFRGFSYMSSSLLRLILILLGLCLLVVPGLIIHARLSLFRFYLIEKQLGAYDSLMASFRITKGNTGRILLINLLMYSAFAMISIVGSIVLPIFPFLRNIIFGALYAYLYYAFAMCYRELTLAHIYRFLSTPAIHEIPLFEDTQHI